MIYLLGEILTDEDIKILTDYADPLLKSLTKKDHLLFFSSATLVKKPEFIDLLEGMPFSTVILDGDVSMYSVVDGLAPDRRLGKGAFKLSDSVSVIADGGLFRIEGLKILVCCVGDADGRQNDNYNKRTDAMRKRFAKALRTNGSKVDHIITDIPPHRIAFRIIKYCSFDVNSVHFDRLLHEAEFKSWFFCNFRRDKALDNKFFCVFRKLTPINISDPENA